MDDVRSARHRLIVSIVGPSNAGKSQLARHVSALAGANEVCRVPTDYFLQPRARGESLEGYWARPFEWDWALLADRLLGADGSARTTPDFDFTTFERRSDLGGLSLVLRPVMVLDAIDAFPGARLVVRIDCAEQVRRERVRERDARWGSQVGERWASMERSWSEIRAALVGEDLVVDGTQPLDELAAIVVAAIRSARE
jgi:uridine kinase